MMKPPVAKKIPYTLNLHDHERTDNYFWLKDRENPETISYLKAENTYTEKVMEPVKDLREDLFKEIKGKIKEDDSSAPYFKNGYLYYKRYEKGSEHGVYCRKKDSLDNPEEILLDENKMAEEHPYYEVVSLSVTKDNSTLAFAEDISGRRMYRIRFKDLKTGKFLDDKITNCGSDLAWMNDNNTLYYCVKDEKTLRRFQIRKYSLDSKKSEHVFTEEDETFICAVEKSADLSTILIGSYSTLTTEFRFASASKEEAFEVLLPRQRKHEYYPDVGEGGFYIKTNLNAENFRMVFCTKESRDPGNWVTIQEHNEEVLIDDFEVFKNYLVVDQKVNGLSQLKMYDLKEKKSNVIPSREETFMLYFGNNVEYDSDKVRIGYSSMTTPSSVYTIDLKTFEWTLLKQTPVLGDFDTKNYQSERIWATARDGTKIPASLVYRKDKFKKDGTNPVVVYGYGSYGSTIDPYFSIARLSLLDRGFVYIIAHIRGSEYLGRKWYEDGKLLKKKNTFTDFIDVTKHLIAEKYADSENVFAMGGSAGGLLMGAIANLEPQLWKGLVSHVPFVDVVSTMIDDTIPLTTGEYDEWGNPNEKKYYDYILSYSPYDQIEEKSYPAMLITGGLYDSQVQYWEPTKYVAKLRELKTDNKPLLLHTNMEAGHGGASGRFEHLKEVALDYAFVLGLRDGLIG